MLRPKLGVLTLMKILGRYVMMCLISVWCRCSRCGRRWSILMRFTIVRLDEGYYVLMLVVVTCGLVTLVSLMPGM